MTPTKEEIHPEAMHICRVTEYVQHHLSSLNNAYLACATCLQTQLLQQTSFADNAAGMTYCCPYMNQNSKAQTENSPLWRLRTTICVQE